MIGVILLLIGGFGLGAMWSIMGYPFTTWQYWACLGFVILIILSNYFH